MCLFVRKLRHFIDIYLLIEDNLENLQLNSADEEFINALSHKKVCFVILGQSNKAKSLLVNEILSRHLMPVNAGEEDAFWRIVKIKVGFFYLHNKATFKRLIKKYLLN